ncbi:CLAVATA3/ESR (CLE)-related protein 12-like [Punica granatum]|uniref:Uncharacterized protein n=2 Tax=Punica granatum TaxID=22663 RepID=A0A218Y196_PUNGR|nr:CLAVATA3/ESR (CLE)-related protein 12-like [Punica granatum]OWM90322.1 hypothetical protein CDL15_Pgr014624 [Punica granatum]PKI70369.1 hypothetical protein CRG98_009249 [Punica granatum]
MSPKLLHLLSLTLWLSLLFFFFHAWTNYSNNTTHSFRTLSVTDRKSLAQKYDFTPFLHHRHHRHHHKHRHRDHTTRQAGAKTDPLYGLDKRVVPTGPNPLHH